MIRVALIEDKMRENSLSLWGDLNMSIVDWLMRRLGIKMTDMIATNGSTKGGIDQLILEAVVWKDVNFLNIMEHNALEREMREQIQVADPH